MCALPPCWMCAFPHRWLARPTGAPLAMLQEGFDGQTRRWAQRRESGSLQLLSHAQRALAALVIAVILVGQLESARLEQASPARVAVRHVQSNFLDRHAFAEGARGRK